jgi:hypothetical protein
VLWDQTVRNKDIQPFVGLRGSRGIAMVANKRLYYCVRVQIYLCNRCWEVHANQDAHWTGTTRQRVNYNR